MLVASPGPYVNAKDEKCGVVGSHAKTSIDDNDTVKNRNNFITVATFTIDVRIIAAENDGSKKIFLGREICRPTGPKCEICVMKTECAYYKNLK